MTYRDGFPRFSAKDRVARRGGASQAMRDAVRPLAESLGKPPFRSRGRTGSGRIGAGVGKP